MTTTEDNSNIHGLNGSGIETNEESKNPYLTLMKYRKLLSTSLSHSLKFTDEVVAVADLEHLNMTIKCFHNCIKEFPAIFAFREPAYEEIIHEVSNGSLSVEDHQRISLVFSEWSLGVIVNLLSFPSLQEFHNDLKTLIIDILKLFQFRDTPSHQSFLSQLIDIIFELHSFGENLDSGDQSMISFTLTQFNAVLSPELVNRLNDEERLFLPSVPIFFTNLEKCETMQQKILEILIPLSSVLCQFYPHLSLKYWSTISLQIEAGSFELKKISLEAVQTLVKVDGIPICERIVNHLLVNFESLLKLFFTGEIYSLDVPADLEEIFVSSLLEFLKASLNTMHVFVFNMELIHAVLEQIAQSLLKFQLSNIRSHQLKSSVSQIVHYLMLLLPIRHSSARPFLRDQLIQAIFNMLGHIKDSQCNISLLVYLLLLTLQEDFSSNLEYNKSDFQQNSSTRASDETSVLMTRNIDTPSRLFLDKMELLQNIICTLMQELLLCDTQIKILEKLDGIRRSFEVILKSSIIRRELQKKNKSDRCNEESRICVPFTTVSLILERYRDILFGHHVSSEIFCYIADLFSSLLRAEELVGLTLPLFHDICIMISVPWIGVTGENELQDLKNLVIPAEVKNTWQKLPEVCRKKSLDILALFPAPVAPYWRVHVIKIAIIGSSESLQSSALLSLPLHLHSLNLTSEKLASDLLNSVKRSPSSTLHMNLASILGPLNCVLSGNSKLERVRPCLNDMDFDLLCCNLKCNVCDKELVSDKKNPNWLQEILLDCLQHHDPDIRRAAVKSCKSTFAHRKDTVDILPFLKIIEDPSYQVRMDFSHAARLLLKFRTDSWTDSMNDSLVVTIRQSFTKAQVSCNLQLQETLLCTMCQLGQAGTDDLLYCAIYTFLEYLQCSSPLLVALAQSQIKELAKSKDMNVHKLFKLHWQHICKYVVKDMLNEKNKDPLELSYKITNLCDSTDIKFFLSGVLQFVLPLIVSSGSPQTKPLVKALAKAMQQSRNNMLTENFSYIFSHLVRHCSVDIMEKSLSFVEKESDLELGILIRSNYQRVHNELLLHLSKHFEKVFSALSYLAGKSQDYSGPYLIKKPEDMANYLQPRLLGVLAFFDTKLSNSTVILADKKLALESLISVMSLMGAKHITSVRMKLMATLKIALRFTQEDFPNICCKAWSAFVKCIELPSLGLMLNQVLAALLVLLQYEPEEVAKIFHFLIVQNRDNLKDYFHDLYFIPEMPVLKEINDVLMIYTEKQNSHYDFCSLLKRYENGLLHENLDVKIHALKKLKKLLQTQQTDLHTHLFNRESVDPVISQLVTTMLSGCRETDPRVRLLIVETLGELGAIDPGRLELKSITPKENLTHLHGSVEEENFAYDLIQELVHSFLAADDSRTQDCACYALQEMLQIYECHGSESSGSIGKRLWNRFSPDVLEILTPLLHSKYIRVSDRKPVTYPRPICSSRLGGNFKDWVKNWTTDLVCKVKNEKALRVFNACSKILQYCTNVALYLLPQILVYVLQGASTEHVEEVYCEIVGVLKLCENCEPGKTSLTDLRHMSAQVVFSSLDHLKQWCEHSGTSTNHIHSSGVSDFLNRIPQDLLARASFQCQAYTRALKHLEIFLKNKPNQVQKQLGFLQKLYAALDEPDGVSGVSELRNNEPTLMEQILEQEATGKLQDAFTYYEWAVTADPGNVSHYQGLLRCLMGLDKDHTALNYATGLLDKNPQWKSEINSYRVEAAWKLGSLDQLSSLLKDDSSIGNWGIGVGKLLNYALKSKVPEFFDQLNLIRNQLSGPLSAAAMESGAYQRGYNYLSKLHMLTDLQKGLQVFLNLTDSRSSTPSSENLLSVQNLLDEWRVRTKLVQSSMRSQEPILNLQRVLLMVAGQQHPALKNQIKQEIMHCWLHSAKLARRNNHQQRSFSCLVEASCKPNPQLFIERAKLLWNKGEQQQAIVMLQKGIREHFPEMISLTRQEDKLSCAKSKLMLAQYSEESSIVDSNTLISMYKDVVKVQQDWEEGHFHLGKYFDRILNTIDKADIRAMTILDIVKNFGKSLQYDCAHIYHSMPRLLALWFELGSQVADTVKINKRVSSNIDQILKDTTSVICHLKAKLPAYHFMTAFPQLISRICHSHIDVSKQLQEIIAHLLITYPQQVMWMLTSVSKSSYQVRVDRCTEVFHLAHRLKSDQAKFINDCLRFADILLDLCNKQLPGTASFNITQHLKALPKFLDDVRNSRILLPLQSQMTASLPIGSQTPFQHNPFPQHLVYISGVVDSVEIMQSLQKPKKVTFRGSDGKLYPMMCKPKDDLRKDCRLMEFNNLVNKYLKKDSETQRRQLHIRTYTVVPLNEECGLIEWVPNLTGLRVILINIYKEKGLFVTARELKTFIPPITASIKQKLEIFKEKFLARHPPVFSEWYLKTFPDPTAWYMAQLSYARTMAVMCMVGYILGLGDRHGENILFDSSCGDTIHVDFNCLFNKGETFDWPERVPFRLTHNMIEAMGPLGIEGVFRKACEATMRVMRNQTETLMSVLKPFIHDPLVEWGKTPKGSSRSHALATGNTGEIENEKAVSHVQDIEHRLKGIIIKGKKKSHGLPVPLSIEGQEATDENNLCQMYVGWAAYM